MNLALCSNKKSFSIKRDYSLLCQTFATLCGIQNKWQDHCKTLNELKDRDFSKDHPAILEIFLSAVLKINRNLAAQLFDEPKNIRKIFDKQADDIAWKLFLEQPDPATNNDWENNYVIWRQVQSKAAVTSPGKDFYQRINGTIQFLNKIDLTTVDDMQDKARNISLIVRQLFQSACKNNEFVSFDKLSRYVSLIKTMPKSLLPYGKQIAVELAALTENIQLLTKDESEAFLRSLVPSESTEMTKGTDFIDIFIDFLIHSTENSESRNKQKLQLFSLMSDSLKKDPEKNYEPILLAFIKIIRLNKMPSEWSELEKDIPILLIEALSAFKKAGQRIETAHLDELTDYLKKVKYFEMLDSNRKKIFAKAVVASNEKILIYAFWNDFNQKFNPTEIVALSNRLCAYQDAELLRLTIGSCNASSPGALRLTLDVLHAASLLADPSLFQLLNEKILKKGRILAEKLSDQDKAKFLS